MKLLLHTCCAPCTIYPLEQALKDGYNDITLFYYNPNIHPQNEYYKRKDELCKIVDLFKYEDLFKGGFRTRPYEYDPKEFFDNVSDYDQPKKRCFGCWSFRMQKTAEAAKQNNYDAFTSTLLVSPYQDNSVLKKIGEQMAQDYDVSFYYKDFQKGFKEAHKKAHEKGIYCQNYCGCVFSVMEREERRGTARRARIVGK